MLRTIEFVVIKGIVVNRVFQFPRHIVVGVVEKPDKAIDFVARLLAELAYCDKQFFGGGVGRKIRRIGGALRGFRCRFDGHICVTLRINLSHDIPHSLGQARHGVGRTAAGRLIFKPE